MVDSRPAPIDKCHFAALLPLMVLLAAGVPALAAVHVPSRETVKVMGRTP